MLDVFSVYWGDKYDKAYVYHLRDSVAKYLTVPHEFKCITKEKLDGIHTVNPPVPYQGWWQKIGLFAPQIATGPSLYFDLDVVITGSLDYLEPYTKYDIAAPANWAQSGHGGIQSSVMAWRGNYNAPYRVFKEKHSEYMGRLWGDQEFLTELRGDNFEKIPRVCSYKYHVRGKSLPDNASVVVFHGKPDPHEVTDKWIAPYTQTLKCRINSGTQAIFQSA